MSSFPAPCSDQENSLRLERLLARPTGGFTASSVSEFGAESNDLAALAAQVLDDPIALRRLGDRVFDLMRLDLRRQQERNRGYRR